jgi:hypothetical protein
MRSEVSIELTSNCQLIREEDQTQKTCCLKYMNQTPKKRRCEKAKKTPIIVQTNDVILNENKNHASLSTFCQLKAHTQEKGVKPKKSNEEN